MKPTVAESSAARSLTIKGARIRIKSVFTGKIPLEKALVNIVNQKLTKSRENNEQ